MRGTVTVEVFRRGLVSVHLELPRRTMADIARAAELSHEPVTRLMVRYVQRIGAAIAAPGVSARRGPYR